MAFEIDLVTGKTRSLDSTNDRQETADPKEPCPDHPECSPGLNLELVSNGSEETSYHEAIRIAAYYGLTR